MRNSLSPPSYRDLVSPSVARSRGWPVIRETIYYLGEMKGEILTGNL